MHMRTVKYDTKSKSELNKHVCKLSYTQMHAVFMYCEMTREGIL